MEVKRGQDFNNPGSQDQDPIFSNYRLPKHEVRLPPPAAVLLLCQALLRTPCEKEFLPRQCDQLEVPRSRSATRAASLRRSSPATWRS